MLISIVKHGKSLYEPLRASQGDFLFQEETMVLKIVCAWCRKDLGSKECEGNGNEEHSITHGICEECRRKVMEEMENHKKPCNERRQS